MATGSDEPITVQAVHDVRMVSVQCFNAAGESVRPAWDFSMPLYELGQQLRPEGDDRPFVLELTLWPSGRAHVTYSRDLRSLSPTRIVWEPDFRYPSHPLPGRVDEAGAGPPRPTDPRTLAEVQALLDEFAELYRRANGTPVEFTAGYSEDEIADAEARMGLRLPEDLRAVYRCMHDDVSERRPLGWFCPLPLDQVVADYLGGAGPGSYGWHDDVFDVFPVVLEAFPPGTIKRVSRSDRWVTFGSDFAMNHCAVDLDPGPRGVAGQLIEYGRDTDGPVRYVADSVLDLLRRTVADLRDGVAWNDDYTLRGPVTPLHRHIEPVGSRSLAAVIAELAQPSTVQQVYLNDADSLDLDALVPLSNLREISINRAVAVRGHLPADLPVEALTLHAEQVDLDAVTGHPTLWALTVKSSGRPTSIAALTSVPTLTFLDLGGAEIADLHRITDLASVRVLALNRAQWEELRAHDVALGGLAAVELSGHARLADAIEWAAWLTAQVRPEATPPVILEYTDGGGRR